MDDDSSAVAARVYALAQQPQREFAAVEPRAVVGYDTRWYRRVARELEPLGFASVGDYLALHQAPARQAVLRLLISRHGTIVANAWSSTDQTRGARRWFGRGRVRMLEFATEFSDASVLLTDNGEGLDALQSPPAIERHAMARATALRELFEVHAARIKEILHTRAGVAPQPLVTVDDWMESQHRQHALVTAHRRKLGWATDDELRALVGERDRRWMELVRLELRRLAG